LTLKIRRGSREFRDVEVYVGAGLQVHCRERHKATDGVLQVLKVSPRFFHLRSYEKEVLTKSQCSVLVCESV
jgi:hypothetical protein